MGLSLKLEDILKLSVAFWIIVCGCSFKTSNDHIPKYHSAIQCQLIVFQTLWDFKLCWLLAENDKDTSGNFLGKSTLPVEIICSLVVSAIPKVS